MLKKIYNLYLSEESKREKKKIFKKESVIEATKVIGCGSISSENSHSEKSEIIEPKDVIDEEKISKRSSSDDEGSSSTPQFSEISLRWNDIPVTAGMEIISRGFPEMRIIGENFFRVMRVPIGANYSSLENIYKVFVLQKEKKLDLYDGKPYNIMGYCVDKKLFYLVNPVLRKVQFNFLNKPNEAIAYRRRDEGKFTIFDKPFKSEEDFMVSFGSDIDALLNVHLNKGEITMICMANKDSMLIYEYNEHYHVRFAFESGEVTATIDRETGYTVEYTKDLDIVREGENSIYPPAWVYDPQLGKTIDEVLTFEKINLLRFIASDLIEFYFTN